MRRTVASRPLQLRCVILHCGGMTAAELRSVALQTLWYNPEQEQCAGGDIGI